MWRTIWMGMVLSIAMLGETRPLQAACPGQGRDRAPLQSQKAEGRRTLSRGKAHAAADSGMMLAFGVGLFGCASVCAVESHREERRRQARVQELGLHSAVPA